MKFVVLDTETTGLNSRENAMVQLAGTVIVGKDAYPFNFKIRPHQDAKIDPEALEVNHLTLEEIMSYPKPEEVLPEMKKFFYQFVDHDNPKDSLTPIGYNVGFDIDFLKSFFYMLNAWNSYKNIFNYKCIDMMGVSMMYFIATGKAAEMEHYRQADVAKALGIEFEDASLHDASVDANICMKIFNSLLSKFKLE